MEYHVEFSPRARKELDGLDPTVRERIVRALFPLYSFSIRTGNVRKLEDPLTGYRLRVGEYRILFEIKGHAITVFRVLHRKDAYR